jgi:hypothetical protein
MNALAAAFSRFVDACAVAVTLLDERAAPPQVPDEDPRLKLTRDQRWEKCGIPWREDENEDNPEETSEP